MVAADDLRELAADARARGHEPLAASVEGVAAAFDCEDPVHMVMLHDLWVRSARPYAGLTRLLGEGDAHTEHDAFHAATCLRVVRSIEGWLAEAEALVDAADA